MLNGYPSTLCAVLALFSVQEFWLLLFYQCPREIPPLQTVSVHHNTCFVSAGLHKINTFNLHTNRSFLALDGGAVESQCRHIVDLPLDVEDTLIVSLSRLGLWQVLCS